jgi:hypothetical protein
MTMANLLAPLDNSKTALARIDALAAAGAPTLDAIVDAVQRADYDQAALLALARSFAGEDLSIEVVATILPGLDTIALHIALIKCGTGPRSRVMVDLVRRDGLPASEAGRDIAALLLYVSWRLRGAEDLREQMAWPVRRLLRQRPGPRGMALLVWLVNELNDNNVTGVAADILPSFLLHHQGVLELADAVDQLLAEPVRELVKAIPAREARSPALVRLPLRAAVKPGRNDLCPCGSGRKYKRCCQDKEESSFVASPVAGLSWDKYLAGAADSITVDTIWSLSLRDLAMLNLGQLGMAPLVVAFRRFMSWRRWDLAERALARIAEHPDLDDDDADDFRAELVTDLISRGEWALARHHLDKVVDKDTFARGDMLALALATSSTTALQQLLHEAQDALKDSDQREDGDLSLAFALLDSAPALGILVARGCLTAERQFDSEFLLEQIEKARDRLNLPPGDPAWETWSTLAEGTETDDDENEDSKAVSAFPIRRGSRRPDATAASAPGGGTINVAANADQSARMHVHDDVRALQAALRESSARVAELEQQMKRQEANVAAVASPAMPTSSEDTGAVRRLQAKIGELKGRIDEGNEERRDLRRKLAAASRTRANQEERPSPTARPEADSDGGVPVEMGVRGVLMPRFSRRAEDSLRAVPAHVAAELMRTLGCLSAGDRAAWRNVKQAKDMSFALLMARVGIHHRLLFRADDGVLEVVELVTRESLATTLKRLRSA